MEEKSLRERLLEEVILASNKEEATLAIKSVMSALHINKEYESLYKMSEELKDFSAKTFEIQQRHFNMQTPRNQQVLQEMRTEIGFIYRQTVDKFTHPVTTLKKLIEDGKKEVEFEALQYIDDNPTLFEGVTKSTKREFMGGCPNYLAWVQLSALSYATYQYLDKLLQSTESFLHSLASELRSLDVVNKTDVK